MPRRVLISLWLLAMASVALAGCGGGGDVTSAAKTSASSTTATARGEPPTALKPPPCSPAAINCEEASGTIAYVERVDPDGDGDAHFILISREGITGPGVSIIDVRPDLRPRPLPGPGDRLAASGPVYEGSFGQRQIQADAVVTAEG